MDVLGDLSFMEKLFRSRNSLCKCVLFFIFYFLFSPVGAQTFTQRIQQQKVGQGTITVHESAEIDQLVNDAKLGNEETSLNTTNPSTTKPAITKPVTTKPSDTATNVPTKTASQTTQDETTEEGSVEPTKKIMTGGYKINGYRVQAYAGGNSRKDRQQAENGQHHGRQTGSQSSVMVEKA